MKYCVIFALALATVSAFDLRNAELKQRNIVMPVVVSEGRITNGQNANVGQFPYQVALDIVTSDGSTFICGGSIINKEYVMTAAHCLESAESVSIYFGTTSIASIELEVTVDKDNFIIHEEYDTETSLNDIALIKVPAITYTDNMQPVDLPASASSYPSYIGEVGIASGWGHTSDETGPTADLQWAPMLIINNSECAEVFGPDFPSSQLCVSGAGGVSTCNGDSGGPFVLKGTNTQIGVTSFGTVECTIGTPQSFTRVTSYLPWISSKTGMDL
ncbi:hypothetical protein DOY81_008013 [Sarcophaga bullata]|nr:hypothetical protein DOY81_008013 [Sarcophaga bullata]